MNYIDYDVAHDFKINFESRYKIFENSQEKKENEEFTLKQLRESIQHFHPQGKNTNPAGVLSQVRNIENIIFVDKEQLGKCKTLLELQVLLDSVTPEIRPQTTNERIHSLQKSLYNFKLLVENMKIFPSEKERILGLPFQMHRHQQYPEPAYGTWQYKLFEELFGHPYSYGKDEIDSEEKINKFNYHKFLHPAIIEKYNDGKLFSH